MKKKLSQIDRGLISEYNSLVDMHLDAFRKIQLELFKLGGGEVDTHLIFREALEQNEITRIEYSLLMESRGKLLNLLRQCPEETKANTTYEKWLLRFYNIIGIAVVFWGFYWFIRWFQLQN